MIIRQKIEHRGWKVEGIEEVTGTSKEEEGKDKKEEKKKLEPLNPSGFMLTTPLGSAAVPVIQRGWQPLRQVVETEEERTSKRWNGSENAGPVEQLSGTKWNTSSSLGLQFQLPSLKNNATKRHTTTTPKVKSMEERE